MRSVFTIIAIVLLALTAFETVAGQQSEEAWEARLRQLLQDKIAYTAVEDSTGLADVSVRLGEFYRNRNAFSLASKHYEEVFNYYISTNSERAALTAIEIAQLNQTAGDGEKVVEWYERAKELYRTINQEDAIKEINNAMIPILTEQMRYRIALDLINWNLRADDDNIPPNDAAMLHNSAGIIHTRMGNFETALRSLNEAETNALKEPLKRQMLVTIYTNMAICNHNLRNEEEMFRLLKKALDIAEETELTAEMARIEMLLAVIYSSRGDIYNAGEYCQDCIESAREAEAYEILQVCYEQYAEVLKRGNDFDQALDNSEMHITLRDSLANVQRLAQREREQIEERHIQLEQQILLELAEEERREQEIRSERERSQNRLELIERELALSESERGRINIQRDRERTEAILRLEADSLQRERELAEGEAREAEAKTGEAEAAARAAEADARAAKAEAERERFAAENEKKIRRATVLVAILMVIVAIMALYSLLSIRRKNRKLAESKRKIEEINCDLESKNREVWEQKEIIELKNQSITDSIMYASRIQKAVLLPETFLFEWGLENFIYFRPKDIVSGDFYWGFRKRGKIYIAAADCTGHGVPGAFMSMLGNAFLNEILITREELTAAAILNHLRDEIIRALRQKGITGEARDGIDMSLAVIDSNRETVQFAGANNPLYHARNGEITKYNHDRMPIGIHVSDPAPFTNHIIEIEKGDAIYLFSDGYADQFGGEAGKKFMYKPFQRMLESVSAEPMERQLEVVAERFDNWRGDYEQIDDVLVIGIRF